MRICVLTSSFPRYSGDKSGAFILDVLKKISNSGDEVTVIAPDDIECKNLKKPPGLIIKRFTYFLPRRFQRVAYRNGLEVNLRQDLIAKLQLPIFLISFLIVALANSRKSDLIHAHWTLAGLIAVFLKKVFKKKLIITLHGSELAVAKKGALRQVTAYILDKSDIIITVSNYLAKNVSRLLNIKKKVCVVPNGVDLDRYRGANNTVPRDPRKVIFIGRLHPSKGVDILLRALRELTKKLPDTSLMIVGAGKAEFPLKQLTEKLSLEKNVLFKSEVSRSKIPDLLAACSVLVLPSRREGFGVVLIEAMAAGVPVVGSNTGGISDIIQDGYSGFKFPVGDYKKLSSLIHLLLVDEELYRKLSLNARRFIEDNFSSDIIARRHRDLYEALVSHNASDY